MGKNIKQEVSIGLDTGFGTVVAASLDNAGYVVCNSVPSHSGITRIAELSFSGASIGSEVKSLARSGIVTHGGNTYAVGDGAFEWGETSGGSMLYTQLADSRYKSIVYAALSKLIGHGQDVRANVALALPNETIASGNGGSADYGKLMKGAYNGRHEWVTDGKEYSVTIRVAKILPQAMCALSSLDEGAVDETGITSLVTIGANTIEVFTVRNGRVMARGFAGNRRGGVIRLARLAFGDMEWPYADDLIRRRQVGSEFVEQWAEEVAATVDSSLAGIRVDSIVLCGGGTQVAARNARHRAGTIIAGKLEGRGRVIIHQDPVDCVAIGALAEII